jgi:hypothetical protein
MRRSRKPVYVQAYRGFESPPLRYTFREIYAGSFPVDAGPCGGASSARSGPVKTAPGGVRLPHNFPTVGFGMAGAASSFMRFRKIGVEEALV